MYLGYEINEKLIKLSNEAEANLKQIFKKYEENALTVSARILKAFQEVKLANEDFAEVTGYGYYDSGRNKLEKVYAKIYGAEDALVRTQIMSGTHALSLTLSGLLKYNDTFISISGEPYDSLKSVIGLCGDSNNSLLKNGIKYEQIDLINDDFDYDKIASRLSLNNVKLVEIQRSRGYSHRKSITIDKVEKVCKLIKNINKNVIIMVDNCYCDFVEDREPTQVGADILIGSLFKNLSGGNTVSGGYIVGKKDLVWSVSERLSAPCIGKDIGANFNQNRNMFRGLFMAPSTVCSSLKSMTFASYVLEKLKYNVSPKYNETRADIVQTIDLQTSQNLIKFCEGIQFGSPVDSFVKPIPAETPGYPHQEVMAGGSFITGSTIELSCDGPLTEPYTAFMQGGLTYEYGKLGILIGINNFLNEN